MAITINSDETNCKKQPIPGGITSYTSNPNVEPCNLNVDDLKQVLAIRKVIIESNTITVQNPITWNSRSTLTIKAGKLEVDSTITAGGDLTLAVDDIEINASVKPWVKGKPKLTIKPLTETKKIEIAGGNGIIDAKEMSFLMASYWKQVLFDGDDKNKKFVYSAIPMHQDNEFTTASSAELVDPIAE